MNEMTYVKHEFPVTVAEGTGRATLEIWVSNEESPYVELGLTTQHDYHNIGFRPDTTLEIAELLDQHADFRDIDGIDGHDGSIASLTASWDDTGVDLTMHFQDRTQMIRASIDDFEQAEEITDALRSCAIARVAAE